MNSRGSESSIACGFDQISPEFVVMGTAIQEMRPMTLIEAFFDLGSVRAESHPMYQHLNAHSVATARRR